MKQIILSIMCAMLLLTSCATGKTVFSPRTELLMQELAVKEAVSRIIKEFPEVRRTVIEASYIALVLLEDKDIRLGAVEAAIMDTLKAESLTEREKLALETLISAIEDDLMAYFEAKGIDVDYDEEALISVRYLMNWVFEAARGW